MLAALCLAMVFALSLSSYMALCYTSLGMSTRAIEVAHSTELAETGAEQALYALNNNDWTGWTLSGSTATETMTMTSGGLVLTSTNPTSLNYGNGVEQSQVVITGQQLQPLHLRPIGLVGRDLHDAEVRRRLCRRVPYPSPERSTRARSTSATSAPGPCAPERGARRPRLVTPSTSQRRPTPQQGLRQTGIVDSYNSNPV